MLCQYQTHIQTPQQPQCVYPKSTWGDNEHKIARKEIYAHEQKIKGIHTCIWAGIVSTNLDGVVSIFITKWKSEISCVYLVKLEILKIYSQLISAKKQKQKQRQKEKFGL